MGVRAQALHHWATLPALQLSIAFLSTGAQRSQVTSLMSHSKAVAQLASDERSLVPPTLGGPGPFFARISFHPDNSLRR